MSLVFGTFIFFGIVIYWFLTALVQGTGAIVQVVKSRTYKHFSVDRISIEAEKSVDAKLSQPGGLCAVLRKISQELGQEFAYFWYENLITIRPENQRQIARDYMLSKLGFTSREMAEMGCYRIPEESPKMVCDAMQAYMHLIQENIKKETGTSMWMTEGHWKRNEYWGETKNYKWVGSPADKSWWSEGKNLTSGYRCIYRRYAP